MRECLREGDAFCKSMGLDELLQALHLRAATDEGELNRRCLILKEQQSFKQRSMTFGRNQSSDANSFQRSAPTLAERVDCREKLGRVHPQPYNLELAPVFLRYQLAELALAKVADTNNETRPLNFFAQMIGGKIEEFFRAVNR